MVNGMLMDTEDEMKRRPTARVKGLFSGLARLTMARKEDAVLLGSSPEVAMSLASIDRFGFGDVCATSGFAEGCAGFSRGLSALSSTWAHQPELKHRSQSALETGSGNVYHIL